MNNCPPEVYAAAKELAVAIRNLLASLVVLAMVLAVFVYGMLELCSRFIGTSATLALCILIFSLVAAITIHQIRTKPRGWVWSFWP